MCVLDYEFQILDNAFLVHKPGIKTVKKDRHRDKLSARTNLLIKNIILPELQVLYGTRNGCTVWPRLDSAKRLQVRALNMIQCYQFVTYLFSSPSLWLAASYYRSNTKHIMILWHYLLQMFLKICRSHECLCITFEFMGFGWITFTALCVQMFTRYNHACVVHRISKRSFPLFWWGGKS
jgi:hypothetical protein